ncbi:galactose mutarotase-like protein [Rickenella mellea]|uniref:Glucose-6-phosphate 1-epimerase n=1 Tax=Rickenella mellea TaxID=50990 RepID=A0A4Y7QLA9_9AGAM|nr:galactose mutarotase-like protein [Rickenella mellea]
MPAHESSDGKRIFLTHPKGASVEILLFGATVVSWKCRNRDGAGGPVERLFVSSKSALDGTKPVRGGIPIVFPFFGPPTKEQHAGLPQHGFARSSWWSWDKCTILDKDSGVSVRLTFQPAVSVTHDSVRLTYVVTLTEHQLSTNLHVENTSESDQAKAIEFQALLHNYIAAPASEATVVGLKGLQYTDKTDGAFPRKLETRDNVDVLNYTDYVYEDGPREYIVEWAKQGIKVKAIGLKDVVVWNPSIEAGKKMGDMEEGGWEKYICVEPGYVVGWASVEPGQTWMGGQSLTVVD